jgi:hypothetical protein
MSATISGQAGFQVHRREYCLLRGSRTSGSLASEEPVNYTVYELQSECCWSSTEAIPSNHLRSVLRSEESPPMLEPTTSFPVLARPRLSCRAAGQTTSPRTPIPQTHSRVPARKGNRNPFPKLPILNRNTASEPSPRWLIPKDGKRTHPGKNPFHTFGDRYFAGNRRLDATVTSLTASVTPPLHSPGHDSKAANFPIQAPVAIRIWKQLIPNGI